MTILSPLLNFVLGIRLQVRELASFLHKAINVAKISIAKPHLIYASKNTYLYRNYTH